MTRHKRRKKLIKPAFQLRMTLVFFLTSCAAVLAQFIMLHRVVNMLAAQMPDQTAAILELWPTLFRSTLWLTVGLVVPMTLGVGILFSFHIAGPLHRFEVYMGQIARGEDPGPCKIRRGDMLQGFCDQLNLLTDPMRASNRAERAALDDVESLVRTEAPEEAPTSA